jgi:hypothetical protein
MPTKTLTLERSRDLGGDEFAHYMHKDGRKVLCRTVLLRNLGLDPAFPIPCRLWITGGAAGADGVPANTQNATEAEIAEFEAERGIWKDYQLVSVTTKTATFPRIVIPSPSSAVPKPTTSSAPPVAEEANIPQ